MANPLLERSLAKRGNTAVEKLEERAINSPVKGICENFHIDKSLAIQHQAGSLFDRVVPGEVPYRDQVAVKLQNPQILHHSSKCRHRQFLLSSFAESLRPDV
jgi:hypothetical protein